MCNGNVVTFYMLEGRDQIRLTSQQEQKLLLLFCVRITPDILSLRFIDDCMVTAFFSFKVSKIC